MTTVRIVVPTGSVPSGGGAYAMGRLLYPPELVKAFNLLEFDPFVVNYLCYQVAYEYVGKCGVYKGHESGWIPRFKLEYGDGWATLTP